MHNKRVLITGGAGGLGAKASWEFAAQGAQVIALDRGGDIGARLGAVGTAYGTVSGSVGWLEADLADTATLAKAIETEIQRNGAFDVLINNAAIYPSKPFMDYADEELRQVHAVNTHAPLRLAQMLVPGMRDKGWGRIINISSITFYGGWSELLPYVTSKGALVGATRALARELGVHGITVNCVSPGAFPTAAEAIHPNPEAYNAQVLGHQSIKHRGEAADIANALLFLASERSGFITGQTLAVDGGWYMS
jgi:NAD(P)-dependent dehydrogenase (short-subunit alcohol dehydrogenase family)